MRPSRLRRLAWVQVLSIAACAGPTAPDPAPAPAPNEAWEVVVDDRPPSAFAALVRVLEAVDALRGPQADIRVRAAEADALEPRGQLPEHVRILLDVTLFAPDFDAAQAALDELVSALETEGRATQRTPQADALRVGRVFGDMPWTARAAAEEEGFADLVSVSNTIRIEVRATDAAPLRGAHGPAPVPGSPAVGADHESVASYLRRAAAEQAEPLGPLESTAQLERTVDGATDLRYRLRPARRTDSYGRLQIGRFLQALEERSPGVRLTRVALAPAEPGEDVQLDRWTFEAEVNLRMRPRGDATGGT